MKRLETEERKVLKEERGVWETRTATKTSEEETPVKLESISYIH